MVRVRARGVRARVPLSIDLSVAHVGPVREDVVRVRARGVRARVPLSIYLSVAHVGPVREDVAQMSVARGAPDFHPAVQLLVRGRVGLGVGVGVGVGIGL